MRNFLRMPYFLFSPLTWGLLWGLLLLLAWGRLSRAWRGVGVAVGVVILVMCMPLGANLLEYALESRVKESSRCTGQDAGPIVVLSGGFEYDYARAGRGEHTLTALADSGAWAQLRFRVTGVGEPSAQVLEHVVGR